MRQMAMVALVPRIPESASLHGVSQSKPKIRYAVMEIVWKENTARIKVTEHLTIAGIFQRNSEAMHLVKVDKRPVLNF